MKKRVLIIEDELAIRLSLKAALQDCSYEVEAVETLKEGRKSIETFLPHVVLLDVRLPDGNGMDFLYEIKDQWFDIQVIIMTAYDSTELIMKAIKGGACEFISKPFELQELIEHVEKAFERVDRLEDVFEIAGTDWVENLEGQTFIAKSKQMQNIIKKVALAAATDTTVLIQGDTGTGKEVIARLIHQESHRAAKPFMALNCGALPIHLIESELFGHEKGSFTGAIEQKKGIVEIVNGGTLFLDEIGEMPLDVQVKLLRFLEDGSFRRIGGLQNSKTNLRIVAATNRSLQKAVAAGMFRSDLFYRLYVIPLQLPPLKERNEDIELISKHYLREFSNRLGKNPPPIHPEDIQSLLQYDWPGNVRELRNVIERYVVLYESGVKLLSLIQPDNPERNSEYKPLPLWKGFSMKSEIEKIEKMYIKQALKQTDHNISKSAELLGLSRFSLQRRLDKMSNNKHK